MFGSGAFGKGAFGAGAFGPRVDTGTDCFIEAVKYDISVSGVPAYSAAYPDAPNVYDGSYNDTGTSYNETSFDRISVYIKLDTAHHVDQIRYTGKVTIAGGQGNLYYSNDGSSWTLIGSADTINSAFTSINRTGLNITAQYWCVQVVDSGIGECYCSDFRLYDGGAEYTYCDEVSTPTRPYGGPLFGISQCHYPSGGAQLAIPQPVPAVSGVRLGIPQANHPAAGAQVGIPQARHPLAGSLLGIPQALHHLGGAQVGIPQPQDRERGGPILAVPQHLHYNRPGATVGIPQSCHDGLTEFRIPARIVGDACITIHKDGLAGAIPFHDFDVEWDIPVLDDGVNITVVLIEIGMTWEIDSIYGTVTVYGESCSAIVGDGDPNGGSSTPVIHYYAPALVGADFTGGVQGIAGMQTIPGMNWPQVLMDNQGGTVQGSIRAGASGVEQSTPPVSFNYIGDHTICITIGDLIVTTSDPCGVTHDDDEENYGDHISLLRDYTDRLMVAWCHNDPDEDEDGNLQSRVYDNDDDTYVDYDIDITRNCRWPRLHLHHNVIECTYLRDSAPQLARSLTHGRTWSTTWTLHTIPGSYSVLTSALLRERMIIAGYRDDTGTGGVAAWYVRVGTKAGDGDYDWSAEVDLGLADFGVRAHLVARDDDAVLDFAYLDSAGTPHILRGTELASDGSGNWGDEIDLPGTYDALTFCHHRERIVFAGFHDDQWYIRVGKKESDGTYTWSSEVSLALTNPKPRAQMTARFDGVLEFGYITEDGEPAILRGYKVALDGTGDWVAV